VSRVARQHCQVDAELGERAIPFPVVIGIKNDAVIGGNRKPTIGLDFSI
jgi:hypothetical protein